MRKAYILIAFLVVAVFLLLNSIFIVDERQKALVLQFGQIRDIKEEPGLSFKLPLIQNVVRYDDRILSLDTDPIEITPSDDRRLIVDAFARYRIADVEQFRRAVGVGGVRSAETRLSSILITQTRAVLGSDGVTSNTILSADRAELMTRIRDEARARANALGIDVIDVRLKQTALPDQNLSATFERMRAERQREATDERARGEEAAQRVRAQADRTGVELVSEAQREAEIARGEADATRSSIFAEAFSADPEFFEFYRSLNAYERSLQGNNSTLVLSPDSEFFEYLKSDQPRGTTARENQQAARPEAAAAAETSDTTAPSPAADAEPADAEASADAAALPEGEDGEDGATAAETPEEDSAAPTGGNATQGDAGAADAAADDADAEPAPDAGTDGESAAAAQ